MQGSHLAGLLLICGVLPGENWPGFRGPTRQGISAETGLPVEFGAEKNLAWKTPIPGQGWSSPVVWNQHVFLTTATEDGASCRLLALDAPTGKILWNQEITRQPLKRIEKKNSYASPTPTTDGRTVYAVCGDGTFAAYDFRGRRQWINRDYPHYSQHGLGSSPVLANGLLIMARDGSAETGDLKVGWQKPWDQSYVVALDPKTGKERWKARRGLSRIAHVTPNVKGALLVSGAGDVVQGFDLPSGKLLWTGASQGEGVVPSVVLGEQMAYTASGFEKPTIRAFRLDGSLAWEQTKGVPMIPSLLLKGNYLYAITTNGVAQCMDAATGEVLNQQRVGGNFSASPVWAEGRIYFASEEGEVVVVREGQGMEVLARNALGEMIQASPAISGGRLFVRTATHLWAFRQ
jgi:outer membrane protein assembly factor BamB